MESGNNKSNTNFKRNDAHWMSMFQQLKKFHDKNGHCAVKTHTKQLYDWTIMQRYRYTHSQLIEERCNLLNSIGFFDKVLRPSVPSQSRRTLNGSSQSSRVSSTRLSSRRIMRNRTTPIRTPSKRNEFWMVRFEEMKKFHANNGHCEASRTRNSQLYDWRRRQLQAFQFDTLTIERRDLLHSIGFFQDESSGSSSQSSSTSIDSSSHHVMIIDLTTTSKESFIDRVKSLQDTIGVMLKPNDSLYDKVVLLEMELFGKVKCGTIKERIEYLENELK